ncbi:MAG: hypothetical protein KF799_09980 [Bdellovibrionales bacterium]|nr:hypothetical protein [Bdellovibrionales bacterium]
MSLVFGGSLSELGPFVAAGKLEDDACGLEATVDGFDPWCTLIHMTRYVFVLLGMIVAGCAQLHHVQMGDVYSPDGYVKQPFDIKVSETGVNLQEIGAASKALLNKQAGERMERAAALVGLFQMGPRTGNPVYVTGYTDGLVRAIYEKCPSGNVSGLMSVRETRKYPVVSGEIVKITGYCLVKKEAYKGEG